MSIWMRLRFLIGIVVVITLVGLLVLYLNATMSTVRAQHAELQANTTTVGVDYPGLVNTQNVTEGDTVTQGQTLFTISSTQLTTDLAAKRVSPSALPFKLSKAGEILVQAPGSGVVEKINYPAGAYVPGGTTIASIASASTMYVSGHFHLAPPDYARLKRGSIMDVTLPDDRHMQATVYNIALQQNGNTVDTVVKGRLQNTTNQFPFPVGTPVDASLRLTNRTWAQDVTHFLKRLFQPSAA